MKPKLIQLTSGDWISPTNIVGIQVLTTPFRVYIQAGEATTMYECKTLIQTQTEVNNLAKLVNEYHSTISPTIG